MYPRNYSDNPPDRGDVPKGYEPPQIKDEVVYVAHANPLHSGEYKCEGKGLLGETLHDTIIVEGEECASSCIAYTMRVQLCPSRIRKCTFLATAYVR
jgi:hypothetical protein